MAEQPRKSPGSATPLHAPTPDSVAQRLLYVLGHVLVSGVGVFLLVHSLILADSLVGFRWYEFAAGVLVLVLGNLSIRLLSVRFGLVAVHRGAAMWLPDTSLVPDGPEVLRTALKERLELPRFQTRPLEAVRWTLLEARTQPGLYCCIGPVGIGKTTALEGVGDDPGVLVLRGLVLSRAMVQERLSGYVAARTFDDAVDSLRAEGVVVVVDDAEMADSSAYDVFGALVSSGIGLVLLGTDRIASRVAADPDLRDRALIRYIPGITRSTVAQVARALQPTVSERVIDKMSALCLPSMQRLAVLAQESYRLMVQSRTSALTGRILVDAQKSLLQEERNDPDFGRTADAT